MNSQDLIYDGIPKFRPFYICLFRIIIWNNQFSKQLFSARDNKRYMVDAYTFPCLARFLPMPLSFIHFLCHFH